MVNSRSEKKMYVIELLASRGCAICGEKDVRCLQFDHLRDKDANVSELVKKNAPWNVILAEIKKTQVLCSSCHCKETERRANSRRHLYWIENQQGL